MNSRESYYNEDSSFEEIKNLDNIIYIRSKLDAKKNELKELKKQYNDIFNKNSELKINISELENYKILTSEKLKKYEDIFDLNENKYLQREMEMINKIKSLEEKNNFLEEKYGNNSNVDKIKEKEFDLLNQKLKDMEIILEENGNE